MDVCHTSAGTEEGKLIGLSPSSHVTALRQEERRKNRRVKGEEREGTKRTREGWEGEGREGVRKRVKWD